MVLVDTSIWIDHLRKGAAVLPQLLHDGEATQYRSRLQPGA